MTILDFFFPKYCLTCHKAGTYICDGCLRKVALAHPVCPGCKRFSLHGATHVRCKTNTYLDGALAMYRYEGVVRKAIVKFKYNFVSQIASELCVAMVGQLASEKYLFQNALLVPVPLHKKRSRWRGFNQSMFIAQGLSSYFSVPAVEMLVCVGDGVHQAQLHKKERLRNMRGKYAVNNRLQSTIHYSRVVLVDDVWTTGSTLNEAARVLKEAGIKEVWGVTVAR